MTKGRRVLRFAKLTDVIEDVDTLLAGHHTVGKWTLAQILHHLAVSIRYTTEGFPGRHAPWLVRKTFGWLILQIMLRTGRIAEGVRIPTAYLPTPDLSLDIEIANLKSAIETFLDSIGPYPSHPLVGCLTRDKWERYHCIHCAHHLSFAVPDKNGD